FHSTMKVLRVLLLVAIVDAQRLGQYNVDRSQISVSGFSSGGAFSTQFHVVHSGTIMGAAIFAGMPYNCFIYYGVSGCGQEPENINIARLVQDTRDFAITGDIDAVEGISRAKVYLFQGPNDFTVQEGNGPAIREYYQNFGSDIATMFTTNAGHGFPTNDYGNDCDTSSPPAINRCDYSGAFGALNHIYGGSLTDPGTAWTPNEENRADFTSNSTVVLKDACGRGRNTPSTQAITLWQKLTTL
ncbi:unnamed protein product, partial [Owenia fusiformis]